MGGGGERACCKIPICRAGKGPQPMRAWCIAYCYASENRSVSFLLCVNFQFGGQAWARGQCVHSAVQIVMASPGGGAPRSESKMVDCRGQSLRFQ